MSVDQTSLKKLNFVPEYGTKGYNLASNVYSTAKNYVPASFKEQLTKVEESVAAASAPYVTKAQDKGTELLKVMDDQVSYGRYGHSDFLMRRSLPSQNLLLFLPRSSRPLGVSPEIFMPIYASISNLQVDKAVHSVGQVYQSNSSYIQTQLEKQRQFHQQNLESYKAAREQYLKKVEESIEFLKTNGVAGAAKKATDEVAAAVAEARKLPGMVVKQVHEAFERLLAFEPVQTALKTARPAVDAAYARYESLHQGVLASPQYKRAFEFSQTAVTRAQETFLYRKAKENIYPLVAKYADPAYESITSSTYFKAALEHVTPKAA